MGINAGGSGSVWKRGREPACNIYPSLLVCHPRANTRTRVLYAAIKDEIRGDEQKALKLADDLSTSATAYSAILNSASTFWSEYGDAAQLIRTLNYFRLKQIRPLLLAITSKMKSKDVEKCLKLLVRCSVRFLIVGGLGGGRLEEKYTEAANRVTAGHIKTANKLLEFLLPADSKQQRV